MLKALLILNSNLRVGNIGFEEMKDKYLITVSTTIPFAKYTMTNIELYIQRLVSVNHDIYQLLQETNQEFKAVLMREYYELERE